MGADDLKEGLNTIPFLPFRIVTTTGKSYEITERDRPLVFVGKRCVFIGYRVLENDPMFNRQDVVSLIHIVRLEPIPVSKKVTENGEP